MLSSTLLRDDALPFQRVSSTILPFPHIAKLPIIPSYNFSPCVSHLFFFRLFLLQLHLSYCVILLLVSPCFLFSLSFFLSVAHARPLIFFLLRKPERCKPAFAKQCHDNASRLWIFSDTSFFNEWLTVPKYAHTNKINYPSEKLTNPSWRPVK